MKKSCLVVTATWLSWLPILISPVLADDRIDGQMLRIFPQADRDEDGILSAAELAMINRQALKRFPQLDQNGDGVLSDQERMLLLKMAQRRLGNQSPSSPKTSVSSSKLNRDALLLRLGLKAELDIEYRINTSQQANKLDFIYPKNKVDEKSPLLIYIHGGGNTGGTKSAIYSRGNLIIEKLTDAGFAIATIDYRVFGKGEQLGFHQLFQDCKDALRFLAKNAERFEIDRQKFVTWGTSAGGSKALVTALTASDFLPGKVSGSGTEHTVVGAISFYGATSYVVEDLWAKRTSRRKVDMVLQPSDGLTADQIRKLISADLHLKSSSPPILLVHGDSDVVVPVDLSRHLHQLAMEKDVDSTFLEVKHAAHGFKPVDGNKQSPSITWDEAQQIVIDHALKWVE